jgi:hypothetical protein
VKFPVDFFKTAKTTHRWVYASPGFAKLQNQTAFAFA